MAVTEALSKRLAQNIALIWGAIMAKVRLLLVGA